MCLFLLSFVASTSGLRKFAVARPFSSGDAPLLAESFDVWSTFPPCREGAGDDPPDLYLVFSQSFENNQVATNATQDVERIFDDTEGWGGCFGQIYTLATEIPPEKDIYKKNEINTNVMWVNGPNRQFERTVRSLQDAGVELFYLMEMDSVPTKPYWLDTLVEDVQNQETEFAILGRCVALFNFFSDSSPYQRLIDFFFLLRNPASTAVITGTNFTLCFHHHSSTTSTVTPSTTSQVRCSA